MTLSLPLQHCGHVWNSTNIAQQAVRSCFEKPNVAASSRYPAKLAKARCFLFFLKYQDSLDHHLCPLMIQCAVLNPTEYGCCILSVLFEAWSPNILTCDSDSLPPQEHPKLSATHSMWHHLCLLPIKKSRNKQRL